MSKVKYEIFGKEAEVVSFTPGEGQIFEISFTEDYEGLLSIDGVVSRVTNGYCHFDIRYVEEGEYTPLLVTKEDIIKLPCIKKCAKSVILSGCADEYTRRVSLRERRLEERVTELEKQLSSLTARINDTTIF